MGLLGGLGACKQYRVGGWAKMGHVGYTWAEDEGVWAGMVGGDWEGEEEVKEVKEEKPFPTKAKAPPPKPLATQIGGKKTPKMHIESDDLSDGALPNHKKRTPPPKPPPATKGTPAPKTPPPQRGGDGADDPIVGTKVHVPHSRGVEVGTVRGVHRRKAGVVWVEYLDNPQLYEVAQNLRFPSPEPAHEHLERVRKPKAKPPPPPPSLRASLTRRVTP